MKSKKKTTRQESIFLNTHVIIFTKVFNKSLKMCHIYCFEIFRKISFLDVTFGLATGKNITVYNDITYTTKVNIKGISAGSGFA